MNTWHKSCQGLPSFWLAHAVLSTSPLRSTQLAFRWVSPFTTLRFSLPLLLVPRLGLSFPSDRLGYTADCWVVSQNTGHVGRGRSGSRPSALTAAAPVPPPSGCSRVRSGSRPTAPRAAGTAPPRPSRVPPDDAAAPRRGDSAGLPGVPRGKMAA